MSPSANAMSSRNRYLPPRLSSPNPTSSTTRDNSYRDSNLSADKAVSHLKQHRPVSSPLTGTRPALETFHEIVNTYELLENVLSHLTASDLIRAQGISYQFASIIKSSITLQQQLFLAPRADQDRKQWLVIGIFGVNVESVPLYSVPLGTTIEDFYARHLHLDRLPLDCMTSPRTLNPVLFNARPMKCYAESVKRSVTVEFGSLCVRRMTLGKLKMDMGQFGDMYLTQPAGHFVYVDIGNRMPPTRVEREAGVRLRDVVEVLGPRTLAGVSDCLICFFNEFIVLDSEKKFLDEEGVAARVEVEKYTAEREAMQGYEDGLFDGE